MHLRKDFLIAIAILFAATGCVKTTDSSDDKVGNWVRRWDFEADSRTEAVSAVTDDGRVFVGLGFDGTSRLIDFWEYDNNGDVWYQKASFPGTPRNGAICFSAANKVYVGLGYTGVSYLDDFWEYDPQSDVWTQRDSFPGGGRSGAIAFSILGKGYVSSGYDGNYQKDFWQYDPAQNTWTKKNTHPGFKRNNGFAFVINDQAYLCGGVNNGEYVSDFFMYDPSTESWETKRSIANVNDDLDYDDDYTTITRAKGVSFSLNGKGYITTGINGTYLNNTWEYDPATDLWTEKTGFEGNGREGAISFVVNNRAFVGLGSTSNLRFDDFREFLPNDAQVDND